MRSAMLSSVLAVSFALPCQAIKISKNPCSEKSLDREDAYFNDLANRFKKEERIKDEDVKSHSEIDNSSSADLFNQTKDQTIVPEKKIKNSLKTKRSFSGFYCGAMFHAVSVYPKAELCSLAHKTRCPQKATNLVDKSEIRTLYYGSFAYNRNEWLAQYEAFIGCDFYLRSWLRLGFELQGGFGARHGEISSNGVYCVRGDAFTNYPIYFDDEGFSVKEVNFSYTRQTLETPHYFAFLPRLGIALSRYALLYTTFGVRYGLWEMTDHPDTVDPVTSYNVKTEEDTIYSKNNVTVIGGLGIEAAVTKQLFLRFECLYSNGPNISISEAELQTDIDKEKNRQLESIEISSIRNLSFGIGAGFRF